MAQEAKYLSLKELFDLTGKVAIVTGGAQGIGFAVCSRLGEAGAAVVIADLNLEEGEKANRELTSTGCKAAFVECDVTKEKDVINMTESAIKTFGTVDILVNNVGIYPTRALEDMDELFWNRILDINTKGAFLCSLIVSRQMIKQNRGGSIINIASVSAHLPGADLLAYEVSKGALLPLTRNFALELAPYGIRVMVISPGPTSSKGALSDPEMQKIHNEVVTRLPLGRTAQPHEIANVALFLASPASSYVTGSEIMADGGQLLT